MTDVRWRAGRTRWPRPRQSVPVLTVHLGRRPVITFVGPARLIPALVDGMDASTPKRRAVRSLLRVAAAVRLVPFLSGRLDDDRLQELTAVLALAERAQPPSVVARSVAWPVASRADRRYVLGVGDDGSRIAFTKLSRCGADDVAGLAREAAVLRRIEGSVVGWRAPRLVALDEDDSYVAITTEAVPAGGRPMTWQEISARLPIRSAEARDPGVDDVLTHGDLRPSNASVVAGQPWLIDWEFATWSAPPGADFVGGLLTSWDPVPRDVAVLRERLASLGRAASERGLRPDAVASALGFLAQRGHAWAAPLLDLPATDTEDVMTMNDPQEQSYRQEFDDADKAEQYDRSEYGPGSWSTLLWTMEREFLAQLLDSRSFVPRRERYIDFASGTGRVTAAVAPEFEDAVGVDISEAMAERARAVVPSARFVVADVLAEPDVVGADFDLVTSFRFLLNAEPADRLPVLRWLAGRLRDGDSRLIVNNHANLMSHKAVTHFARRVRSRGRSTTGNVLSSREVESMFDQAELEIVARHGTGFGGGQLARRLPRSAVEAMQRSLTGAPVIERFGENQIYVLRKRG